MEQKDPTTGTLLNFLWTGAGDIYSGDTNNGILLLIIYFILVIITGATRGVGALLLVPYWVWGMVEVNNKIKANNKSIITANEKYERDKQEQSKFTDSKDFKSDVLKLAKLHEAGILGDAEFENKKEALISSLTDKPISVSSDDFLLEILELKVNGILNDDDIRKIKTVIM